MTDVVLTDVQREVLEELRDLDHLGGVDAPFTRRKHDALVRSGYMTANPHDGGVRIQITEAGRVALRNATQERRPPPPPTGPQAEPFSRLDGAPEAFLAFLETEDGQRFWSWLVAQAMGALSRGEKRFSTRTSVALFRAVEKVRINDHFSPWFADLLVQEHPELVDIIERRARKKRGPTSADGDGG